MPCDGARAAVIAVGLFLLSAAPVTVSAALAQSRPASEKPTSPPPSERPTSPPPANDIDRWNRMSPEERERELAKLPPARARQIRQRIWAYNHMSPREREALRRRYETFSQLPPEKQQLVRERLREAKALPRARQILVHQEIQQLRMLPESERQSRMNSPEFHSEFTPPEQQIIRDLSTYVPD